MDNQEPAFDRDKLEQRMEELKAMHTAEPTQDFWLEEMQRCYDPRYFYNNYYTLNGKAIEPLSEEEWMKRRFEIYFDRNKIDDQHMSLLKLKRRYPIFVSPDASETKPSQEL